MLGNTVGEEIRTAWSLLLGMGLEWRIVHCPRIRDSERSQVCCWGAGLAEGRRKDWGKCKKNRKDWRGTWTGWVSRKSGQSVLMCAIYDYFPTMLSLLIFIHFVKHLI